MRPHLLSAALTCVALFTAGCSRSSSQIAEVDNRIAAAQDEIASSNYEDVNGDADCTQNCEGHEAGWAWAKEHDMAPEDCPSDHGSSFEEGCKAYGEALSEAEDRADAKEGQ